MESRIAGHEIRFPLGAKVSLRDLEEDPYSFFGEMHEREPITWVEPLKMWYVAHHADVRAILLDRENFTTAFEGSTIFDTFGSQMLTAEGQTHTRYRSAMQFIFSAQHMSQHLEPKIREAADRLIATFERQGEVDLRLAFASRLPVQTILLAFDMPLDGEASMRLWYDSFERALANFTWQQDVRDRAHGHVAEFHSYVGAFLSRIEAGEADSLFLAPLVNGKNRRLTEIEVIRNLSIIFFGGISTVEALILNSLWALLKHPDVLARVKADLSLLPKAIEETMRWRSPVQTATRHVVRDVSFGGVDFREGDTVSCLLGAANRDPAVFADPERFDIERANLNAHLGFAAGPHFCLGFRLAKMQARIALESLLGRLDEIRLTDSDAGIPRGYEFHRPGTLRLAFRAART